MQTRSARFHRVFHVRNGRQRLVLDVDQRQQLLCEVWTARRQRGDGVPLVKDLVFGQEVVVGIRVLWLIGKVVGGYNGVDIGMGHCLACIYRDNPRMGVRASEHHSVQKSGQVNVRPIEGLARYLVVAIVTDWAFPDRLVLLRGKHDIGRHCQSYLPIISCVSFCIVSGTACE